MCAAARIKASSPSRGWAISNGAPVLLTLYGRSYCHLCEELLAALELLKRGYAFTVEVVDVDCDAVLEERYGEFVPVLMHGDTELCHTHLDAGKVRAYLAKIR